MKNVIQVVLVNNVFQKEVKSFAEYELLKKAIVKAKVFDLYPTCSFFVNKIVSIEYLENVEVNK